MNKEQYLSDDNVSDFISWLIDEIQKERNPYHSYFNRNRKEEWYCSSIFNAYENYYWPFSCVMPNGDKSTGNSFVDSEVTLGILSNSLVNSIESGDAEMVAMCCSGILQWGGLWGISSYRRLVSDKVDLLKDLREGGKNLNEILAGQEFRSDKLFDKERGVGTFNSGYSKFYHCIIPEIVIYDSRVAATMCLFVRKYCQESGYNTIHENIRFRHGPDGRSGQVRDPSTDGLHFKGCGQDDSIRAYCAIRTSWILDKALQNAENRFSALDETSPLRAIEAALFMIGYDLSHAIYPSAK